MFLKILTAYFRFHIFIPIVWESRGVSSAPDGDYVPPDYSKNKLEPHRLKGARWELELKNPVTVYFAMDILDISQLIITNSDFRLDMNIKLKWTEESLGVPDGLFLDNEPNDTKITTDGDVLKDLWTPDLYLPKGRNSAIESLTSDQKSVTIFKNRTIIFTANVFMVIGCPLEFYWYPMETQTCILTVESYSYADDKVIFAWDYDSHTVPVKLPQNFKLRQYYLQTPLSISDGRRHRFGRNETYSRLTVTFIFQREIAHSLIQSYVPTFLIVALSWFSFWLGLEAIPGRVSLIVTCMLTLVTLYSGQKGDLPAVSYVKMIDIWMAGCLGFVFAAMGEFVIVRYISRYDNDPSDQSKSIKTNIHNPHFSAEFNSPYLEFYQRRDQALKLLTAGNLNQSNDMKMLEARLHASHEPIRSGPTLQAWDNTPFEDFYPSEYYSRNPFLNNVVQHQNQSKFPPLHNHPQGHSNTEKPIRKPLKTWEKLDKVSRVAFPFLFVCFSAVYWPVFILGAGKTTNR